MRLAPLLLLLALPVHSQIRSAPTYDGTSPGHPADEPGPDLGSNAEDAFSLLARGDRDAARVSASRCVRSESRDHACRLLVEAVEAGLEAPKLPPSGVGRARADLHFMAGADYYYNGEPGEARREWETCRRLDAGHGFCALGLKLSSASRASEEAPRGAKPRRVERDDQAAQQAYLTGMIYYQRGEYARSGKEWSRCLTLASSADSRADCVAGLSKLRQLQGD